MSVAHASQLAVLILQAVIQYYPAQTELAAIVGRNVPAFIVGVLLQEAIPANLAVQQMEIMPLRLQSAAIAGIQPLKYATLLAPQAVQADHAEQAMDAAELAEAQLM